MKKHGAKKTHSIKNSNRRYFASLIVIAAILLAAIPLTNYLTGTHAASGTVLYVSPVNQTVTSGNQVVVNVIINPGGSSINTVQSVFSWSNTNFSLVSVAPGPSFGSFPYSSTNNSISFSSATTGSVDTTQTAAVVTLQATGTGTSNINLASVCPANDYALTCSAAYDSTTADNDLASVSGTSYSVAAATNPTCPSGDVGTYPSCSAAPPPVTTGSGSSHTSGTNSKTTTSTKSSGSTSKSSASTTTTPQSQPTHTSTTVIVPQTYKVEVTVLNIIDQPLKGAVVNMGSQSAKTNNNGTATIESQSGQYQLTVNAKHQKTFSELVTISSSTPLTQFTVDMKPAVNTSLIEEILAIVAIIIVLLILFPIIRKIFRRTRVHGVVNVHVPNNNHPSMTPKVITPGQPHTSTITSPPQASTPPTKININ